MLHTVGKWVKNLSGEMAFESFYPNPSLKSGFAKAPR